MFIFVAMVTVRMCQWLSISSGVADTPRLLREHWSRWNNWKCTAFTDKVKRNFHFSDFGGNCYNRGKLILLFVWRGSWLVSGKICSAWRWFVQFLLGVGKWHLLSTLSVNSLYIVNEPQTVYQTFVILHCRIFWMSQEVANITDVSKEVPISFSKFIWNGGSFYHLYTG
jgi:hypothetical protein